MKSPATASWGLSISDADFAKLKRGFRARDMDDKWIFKDMTDEALAEEDLAGQATTNGATTNGELTDEELTDEELMAEPTTDEATVNLDQGGNISIRRSWTNIELYRLVIKPSEGGTSAKIEAITWEEDYYHRNLTEEQAKLDAVVLCRIICECDLAAAPDYDISLYSG